MIIYIHIFEQKKLILKKGTYNAEEKFFILNLLYYFTTITLKVLEYYCNATKIKKFNSIFPKFSIKTRHKLSRCYV